MRAATSRRSFRPRVLAEEFLSLNEPPPTLPPNVCLRFQGANAPVTLNISSLLFNGRRASVRLRGYRWATYIYAERRFFLFLKELTPWNGVNHLENPDISVSEHVVARRHLNTTPNGTYSSREKNICRRNTKTPKHNREGSGGGGK